MKKLLLTFALAALAASCTTKTATDCATKCESAEVCETQCETACAEACATEETTVEKTLTFSVYKYKERLYVISNPETIASFKATGHLPFTKTFIGAGPNKETVVVEVDKDDKTLADNLWKAFNEK